MRSRLGDDIDDYCVKCKRLMNHIVVSLMNDEAAKVRCKTCHGDHDYRHEQAPPPKVDARKAALFKQVLQNVTGMPADVTAVEIAAAEEIPEQAAAAGVESVSADAAGAGAGAVEPDAPAVEEKPRAKKKARA